MAVAPSIDVRLVNHPLEYMPVEGLPDQAGGECTFLGRTRLEDHPEHGVLRRLSYEAYEPLAVKVLNSLAQVAAERFGCVFVRIYHALGDVPPGQASVLIQIACVHRREAFDACRFLIDQLKLQAPIWKREDWADGSTWSAGAPVIAEAEHRP